MKKKQVFLIHFAGGNCYSFEFLRPYVQDIEFIPLELPGRGRRLSEPLINDFEAAAKDLFTQIMQKLVTDNYVIFGHSLGAILSLKLAHMLETAGRSPRSIIVSGNPGPGFQNNKKRYVLTREDLLQELKELGGMPLEFFLVEDLFNFFEPIIRADFELVEGESFSKLEPVEVPIYAVLGTNEHFVQHIDNWQKFTKIGFKKEVLKGNHFFIFDHPQRLSQIIQAQLN
jgi:external thioesterase TEII